MVSTSVQQPSAVPHQQPCADVIVHGEQIKELKERSGVIAERLDKLIWLCITTLIAACGTLLVIIIRG